MRSMLLAIALICACTALAGALPKQQDEAWKQLEAGLQLGQFPSPRKSSDGDSVITVVRVDPKLFSLRLLSAAELKEAKRTAKDWSQKFGLLVAINAGMYQKDGSTSVGYMRNFRYVNNKRHARNMKSVLAFNPVDDSVPPVQIIDQRCQDFGKLQHKYNTLVQGIRMIGCGRKNVWGRRGDPWSMAVFGTDSSGHALFIFTQSPFKPHEFIDILLKLPLKIERAMYLEGGSEASLYVAAEGTELEKFGTHGTGFLGLFKNASSWPIPNVIGVERKK